MPIYEYECVACGRRHEILQKIGELPLRECPDCGEPELSKLVSAAGFRLAGSGWYETDFKTGDKRNLAGGADVKPDASSDRKPDRKSDGSAGKTGNSDAAASGSAPGGTTGGSSS